MIQGCYCFIHVELNYHTVKMNWTPDDHFYSMVVQLYVYETVATLDQPWIRDEISVPEFPE